MPSLRATVLIVVSATLAAFSPRLTAAQTAQASERSNERPEHRTLLRPTSLEADRLRLRQLQGDTTDLDTYLLRSPSLSAPRLDGFHWLLPDLLITGNPAFPYTQNDGSLWAGKGFSVRIGGGVALTKGRWHLVLAPEFAGMGNAPFETNVDGKYYTPPTPPGYSSYADPWYIRPYSADVPRRFGRSAYSTLDFGQSGIWFNTGPLELGATSENMWWGPGIRNGILMSDNAAGIPRLELRMPAPWRTRAGAFDAHWFVGALQESPAFDKDPSNDVRSLAAAVVTWRPWFQPLLTFGLERSVFATATGYGQVPARWFDIFANTGHPADHAPTDSSLTPGGRDQLIALFGRWIFPADGVETYFEWARQELPRSLHEFLVAPTNSHGYTLGLQWRRPVPSDQPALRIQAEVTTLEQSSSFRDRNIGVMYTSRRVLQGYTQLGQPIGAWIGPGSSTQWLALDRVAPTWSWGISLSRVRWNEDVHSIYAWSGYPGGGYCNHDVSIIPGARGSRLTSQGMFSVDLAFNSRHNMFFQNIEGCKAGWGGKVDATNPGLRLSFSPALHW